MQTPETTRARAQRLVNDAINASQNRGNKRTWIYPCTAQHRGYADLYDQVKNLLDTACETVDHEDRDGSLVTVYSFHHSTRGWTVAVDKRQVVQPEEQDASDEPGDDERALQQQIYSHAIAERLEDIQDEAKELRARKRELLARLERLNRRERDLEQLRQALCTVAKLEDELSMPEPDNGACEEVTL